jgi:hypothetical protein
MIRTSSLLAAALLATATLSAQAGDISVTDPYALAVPPGLPNSAVFMTLVNNSKENRALVAAETPSAGVVELHTHVHEDGMMKMRKVDKIEIPAGQTVALKPGGLHVMLIGLKEKLEPGQEVHMNLIFDKVGKEHIMAPVRAITPPMAH